MKKHFNRIKTSFFPRWDRKNLWRVSTRSRRWCCGYCDTTRRVIVIIAQHSDPDDRDMLLIHEICHAVASVGHGKAWRARMEKAATRAVELGRDTLAKLLREEIVGYQRPAVKVKEAYQDINDWLTDNPDLTQLQVKRALAAQYGLFVSEVGKWLRRFKKVFRDSKREAQESRARQEAWRKATSRNHSTPSVPR